MKLSTKTRYALSALVTIYKENETKKKLSNSAQCYVSLSVIAKLTKLSSSYLEQLFIKLKKANLVSSTKGNQGGYVLTRSIEEISILDVMNAVGEKIEICANYSDSGNCPTDVIWDNLSKSLYAYFGTFNLRDIVSENYHKITTAKVSNIEKQVRLS